VNSGWVRIVIIAAAVVTGALLIANGFDSTIGATDGADQPTTPAVTPPVTQTPTTTTSPRPSQPARNCEVRPIQVAVYNGTDVDGLAADAAARFTEEGYEIDPETSIADAETETPTTQLFFREQGDRADAECLAARLLGRLDVTFSPLAADTNIPDKVRVAVILGSDYAARFPVQ
jgi:hypothetical protein